MEAIKTMRHSVIENPCHACMPLGAILAFKGIQGAMVIIHGSQGCSTYMRRHISEHYNEPIDVASSSITEPGTIYGGSVHLKKGLDHLIQVYHPELIGILSTCLAETIGEDIARIAAEYTVERDMGAYPLVSVPTPGYGGGHSEGYFLAVRHIIARIARPVPKHHRINVIVPHLTPAEVREIKRIMDLMGVDYILCPDYSETLDSPFARPYQKIAGGGTSLQELAMMGGASATIEMSRCVETHLSPGRYLAGTFEVPLYNSPVPVGIEATDLFVNLLKELTGHPLPDVLQRERGRLLDGMIDSHKYNAEGRAVIFGDPDMVLAVSSICMENGIVPAVAASGVHSKALELEMQTLTAGRTDVATVTETDLAVIRDLAVKAEANIAIGHSDGRYLTEREGIPLVRLGFPIHDRVGGQRLVSVGYAGTMMLLDRITNCLLDSKLSAYRPRMLKKYYSEPSGKF